MTLREFAEKRASIGAALVGAGSVIGLPLAEHIAGRLIFRFPGIKKAPVIGRIIRNSEEAVKDIAIGAFRAGLRGETIRELPLGMVGTAHGSAALVMASAHAAGKKMRADGWTEAKIMDLPNKIKRFDTIAKYIVPSSAAALGASAGALIPSASHKANELGLPTPVQKKTHRKRNALLGAIAGAGAGFAGGAVGLHNKLGPLNILKPLVEKVTGTRQSAKSMADNIKSVFERKPGFVAKNVTRAVFKKTKGA